MLTKDLATNCLMHHKLTPSDSGIKRETWGKGREEGDIVLYGTVLYGMRLRTIVSADGTTFSGKE